MRNTAWVGADVALHALARVPAGEVDAHAVLTALGVLAVVHLVQGPEGSKPGESRA